MNHKIHCYAVCRKWCIGNRVISNGIYNEVIRLANRARQIQEHKRSAEKSMTVRHLKNVVLICIIL